MIVRFVLAAAMAVGLAGCVTVENTLTADQVASLKLVGVTARVAPDAHIWWGDAERAYARSKGAALQDSDALGATPEGKAHVHRAAADLVKAAFERQFHGRLTGTRPVRMEIVIKSFNVASAAQRILVGGHHGMTADVNLIDAQTGAVVIPFPAQRAQAMAGQGWLGVAMDQAIRPEDPAERAADAYASQYSAWLRKM